MSDEDLVRYRVHPESPVSDIDLEDEEFVLSDGRRLTEELADRVADDVSARRHPNLVRGRKSLSGSGKHSPVVQARLSESTYDRFRRLAEARHVALRHRRRIPAHVLPTLAWKTGVIGPRPGHSKSSESCGSWAGFALLKGSVLPTDGGNAGSNPAAVTERNPRSSGSFFVSSGRPDGRRGSAARSCWCARPRQGPSGRRSPARAGQRLGGRRRRYAAACRRPRGTPGQRPRGRRPADPGRGPVRRTPRRPRPLHRS